MNSLAAMSLSIFAALDIIDLSDLNFLPAIYTVLLQVFLPVSLIILLFVFLVILVPPLRGWLGRFFGKSW